MLLNKDTKFKGNSLNDIKYNMPIVINLDVMMAKRKISLTELSDRMDISLANLSILKTNKAKAGEILNARRYLPYS